MSEPVLPAYEREPYRTTLDAMVVRSDVEAGRPFAVLDDTILYPEGGGQPPDHGFLNTTAVVDVQKKGGEIRHYLAAPLPAGPVAVSLDWVRRFDHMQQHTGQHLLSAVAQDRFSWETAAFHLGPEISDVELKAPALSPTDLARLEDAVAAEIRAARAITPRRVSLADFASLAVRTRGLPEGHKGDVRLVEIVGVDLNTCGGTHLASTAEIEVVKLLSTEALRASRRVFFVAGTRARRRMTRHEERNAALRAILGAPDDGLAEVAKAKLEQLAEAGRKVRAAEEAESAAAAEALARQGGPVVDAHYDDRDIAFVQGVARRFSAKPGSNAALLTASRAGQHVFAVAAGEAFPGDVTALGREIAAVLSGKGGGSGRVFQGKASDLDGREQALGLLRGAASR